MPPAEGHGRSCPAPLPVGGRQGTVTTRFHVAPRRRAGRPSSKTQCWGEGAGQGTPHGPGGHSGGACGPRTAAPSGSTAGRLTGYEQTKKHNADSGRCLRPPPLVTATARLQARGPSADTRMKEMCYSATRGNEIWPFGTIHVTLKGTALGDINWRRANTRRLNSRGGCRRTKQRNRREQTQTRRHRDERTDG